MIRFCRAGTDFAVTSRCHNRKLIRRHPLRYPERNLSATAAVSNPGPRLAEVAGSRIRNARRIIPCNSLQQFPAPLPHWRRPPRHRAAVPRSPLSTPLGFFWVQQRSAMEVDCVVGVLKRMAGQHSTTDSLDATFPSGRGVSSGRPDVTADAARSRDLRRRFLPWRSRSRLPIHQGTTPRYLESTFAALRHDAGLPMRMAVARV